MTMREQQPRVLPYAARMRWLFSTIHTFPPIPHPKLLFILFSWLLHLLSLLKAFHHPSISLFIATLFFPIFQLVDFLTIMKADAKTASWFGILEVQ